MPAHYVSESTVIPAPPERVYAILAYYRGGASEIFDNSTVSDWASCQARRRAEATAAVPCEPRLRAAAGMPLGIMSCDRPQNVVDISMRPSVA